MHTRKLPILHILYMSTLHIGRYYILASNYVPSAILHSPQVCGQRNCVNYKALHNMHMYVHNRFPECGG